MFEFLLAVVAITFFRLLVFTDLDFDCRREFHGNAFNIHVPESLHHLFRFHRLPGDEIHRIRRQAIQTFDVFQLDFDRAAISCYVAVPLRNGSTGARLRVAGRSVKRVPPGNTTTVGGGCETQPSFRGLGDGGSGSFVVRCSRSRRALSSSHSALRSVSASD